MQHIQVQLLSLYCMLPMFVKSSKLSFCLHVTMPTATWCTNSLQMIELYAASGCVYFTSDIAMAHVLSAMPSNVPTDIYTTSMWLSVYISY